MRQLVAIKRRVRAVVARVAPPVVRASAMANLAANRRARWRIISGVLWLYARDRLRLGPDRAIRFRIKRQSAVVDIWIDSVFDLSAIEELYMHGEYDAELGAPRVIVDAGSNIGLAAIDFALRCPAAQIVAIEPDPIALTKLKRNVRPFPQITIVPVALASTPGTHLFWSGTDTWASGFTRTRANQTQIRVTAETLDTVLSDVGIVEPIDVLKVDIEGSEAEVLPSFRRLDEVRLMLGEIHGSPDSAESHSVLAFVRAAGFRVDVTHNSQMTQTFIATRA